MLGDSPKAFDMAKKAIVVSHRGTGNPECFNWGFYALGRAPAPTDPRASCEASSKR